MERLHEVCGRTGTGDHCSFCNGLFHEILVMGRDRGKFEEILTLPERGLTRVN